MVHLLLIIIYIAFIGLGLPDSLLGAAWPSMYGELGVPISYMGVLSMTISLGTVVSSLMSDRLSRRFDTGKITAVSTAMTAVAILGFSTSHTFLALWLWAIPYGLGAGSIDSALNNYVALHYASRHMSWLHCMWGVGTIVGPYVISYALTGATWNMGYRYMGFIQLSVTALMILSIPLWQKVHPREDLQQQEAGGNRVALSLPEIFRLVGAKETMLMFFCYCALEQTTMLWCSSYMVLHGGYDTAMAARLASFVFIGITTGRAISGFLTLRFSDSQMIRGGLCLILVGLALLLLPLGNQLAVAGFFVLGFGCAPIYPCVIHSTPDHFGADKSQAIIGVQMASAYVGTCLMPSLFGLIANHVDVGLLPVYLLVILVVMTVMHERVVRLTRG